ncbi:hypothetical protein [Enterococcus sp. CWB-B31]|uniref:hypothetical protein n=1 Tax=Enterococcus sp. CWB-B31 TaxID=2885159 RepID=UPI001E3A5629|nr:hypothetical protein [Enterococcus sp. CWB-B31]MCB5954627.1 hypothetical protein [Enterococcus sp. CWB-B31]
MNSNSPRVLVISNNAFSDTSNNGKTLAAIFSGLKNVEVAQLYFKNEVPTSAITDTYFKITDQEMLNNYFSFKKNAGNRIDNSVLDNTELSAPLINHTTPSISKNQLARIFREIVWKRRSWKNNKLFSWIDEFNPNIILFCAGDSEFSYDIVDVIQEKYKTKLCVYMTDDYILPRKNKSILFEIRRKKIKKVMAKAIMRSDVLFVISDKMSEVYEGVFGKQSIVLKNMSESLLLNSRAPKQRSNDISFVYAGGLHFNRDKTLMELADVLDKYNSIEKNEIKAKLHLYTNNNIDKLDFERLIGFDSVEYQGFVSSKELKVVLNECDIPVHVEAFDQESVESTRLSLSTKIPEYMSLNKPILAIGPSELASMSYLAPFACCVTNIKDLEDKVEILLNSKEVRASLAEKSFLQYSEEYDKEAFEKKMSELFNSILL